VVERLLVGGDDFGGLVERLAESVAAGAREAGCVEAAVVGVHRRGVVIAERLGAILRSRHELPVLFGSVDITLYRDDLRAVGPQPILHRTELPFAVDGAWIVLVDDVLYTGRTARAALSAILDFGRPAKVELAVLVDRGRRELPIQPDHAALVVRTRREEFVEVRVREIDGVDDVRLLNDVGMDA